jgi:hypothetical protein
MSTVCLGCTDQPGGNDDERSDAQRKEEDVPKIISIVKMLLQAGADINTRGPSSFGVDDSEGDTALNLCCCSDDKVQVVQLLIENGARGADTTVRDCNGRNYRDLLQLPSRNEGL